nr:zinc finger, CCHC-type [Tanacetum cinerariifolium]
KSSFALVLGHSAFGMRSGCVLCVTRWAFPRGDSISEVSLKSAFRAEGVVGLLGLLPLCASVGFSIYIPSREANAADNLLFIILLSGDGDFVKAIQSLKDLEHFRQNDFVSPSGILLKDASILREVPKSKALRTSKKVNAARGATGLFWDMNTYELPKNDPYAHENAEEHIKDYLERIIMKEINWSLISDVENATVDQIRRRNKWDNDDYVCRGLILKGIECIFVGYVEHSKAFRFFVIKPNESVSINLINESKDAIFDENRFSSVPKPSLRIPNGTEDIGGSVVPEEVTKEVVQQPKPELRNCKRNRTPKNFRPEFQLYLIKRTRDEKEVINDEIDSIMGNNTWVLADLPPGGYVDSFLNGKLDEDVYMNQPQGFIMSGNENKVCKLIKSLYGLKQAPKQFHQKFDEIVLSNGYLLNQVDKYVYSKFDETGKGVIICIYVDDMLIFGTNQVKDDLTKEFSSSKSSLKDMGEADVILDNSSTSGWVFLLSDGAISWASKKQTCITSSTMESEFMALAAVGKEVECAATLAKTYSQMYNGKSRHLGVKHSMIHEFITKGVVFIEFVRSQRNLDGYLTKGLARELVLKSAEGMRLKSNLVTK